jgi:signal transduction histidine kinase
VQDEAFYEELWSTITAGLTWEGRLINKRKDGSLYTEDATISPVLGEDGRIHHYVAVKRDISAQLALEEQLRQSQKMEAIGQLAGGVAHDFNNILQAIMGHTQILLEDFSGNAEDREDVEDILRNAERASALTRQLLMFSRRQVMHPEFISLNQTIEDLLKMLCRILGEHIRLEWLPGNQLGAIYADVVMMDQVLMNLCVNARDAMSEGGTLTIETQNVLVDSEYCASHMWAKPGRYVLLSVTDTGCGMDHQTLEHIFEPFFTTKPKGRGTGLGLATVYGIVKQHNGMVTAYSEPGKGTTFKVYLPQCESRAVAVGSLVEGAATGGTETILLAEDEEMVRDLAVRILERAGYNVIAAADGEEAVEIFKSHAESVDMLLFDVVMPRLGGHQAYERIRALRPDVPVLFSSGYSENAIHTGFVLHEGLRLLQKPYAPATLLRAVRAALDA